MKHNPKFLVGFSFKRNPSRDSISIGIVEQLWEDFKPCTADNEIEHWMEIMLNYSSRLCSCNAGFKGLQHYFIM